MLQLLPLCFSCCRYASIAAALPALLRRCLTVRTEAVLRVGPSITAATLLDTSVLRRLVNLVWLGLAILDRLQLRHARGHHQSRAPVSYACPCCRPPSPLRALMACKSSCLDVICARVDHES